MAGLSGALVARSGSRFFRKVAAQGRSSATVLPLRIEGKTAIQKALLGAAGIVQIEERNALFR
jgi:hypothetical protein